MVINEKIVETVFKLKLSKNKNNKWKTIVNKEKTNYFSN